MPRPARTGHKQGRDAKGRFTPGQSGNPHGRPPGSQHRATALAKSMLEGEVEPLVRKAIEMAQRGDRQMLSFLLSRILPTAKDQPVFSAAKDIKSASDLASAALGIVEAVAAGRLTPSEGHKIVASIEVARRTYETSELEQRVDSLEETLETARRELRQKSSKAGQ